MNTSVISGEPRHNVDNKLMTVVTGGLALFGSGVPVLTFDLSFPDVPAFASLSSSSSIKPCFANGAGSMPRRVKRSATEAKHLKAVSETYQKQTNIDVLELFRKHHCVPPQTKSVINPS